MNTEKSLGKLKSIKAELRESVRAWGKYAGTPQPVSVSSKVQNWKAALEKISDEPVAADPYFEKALQALAKAWDVRDDVTRSVAWVKAACEDLENVGQTKTKSIDPSRVQWVGSVARVEGEHPAIPDILRSKRIAERAEVRGKIEKNERLAIRSIMLEVGDSYVEARDAAKSVLDAIDYNNVPKIIDAIDDLGVSLYQSVLEKGQTIADVEIDQAVARKGLDIIEILRSRVGSRRTMPFLAKKAYQLCAEYDDNKGKQLSKSLYQTAKSFDKVAVKSGDLMVIDQHIDELHRKIDALEAHWRQLISR